MKGVAVPYLIAIVILLIVAAIVILLIYMTIEGGSWDCTKCKTEFTTWCSECYLANIKCTDWGGGINLGERLAECVVGCGYWPNAAGPHQMCENAEVACSTMIICIE